MTVSSFHNNFWGALTEREKKETELGIKQLDAGQRISLADFKKRIPKSDERLHQKGSQAEVRKGVIPPISP